MLGSPPPKNAGMRSRKTSGKERLAKELNATIPKGHHDRPLANSIGNPASAPFRNRPMQGCIRIRPASSERLTWLRLQATSNAKHGLRLDPQVHRREIVEPLQ